ncbi:MAG: glycosyltransferase [Patescibacteria group bacterium]|jgi:glycosyltransferase involved in cell wall biosynthesis
MDTAPFFSIIIPTLNEEEYLPALLKDIAKQTFSGFETFVVDGKSEDKTQKVAKSYEGVTVVESPKRNVAFQRNLGGEKARGKYLLFLDADTRIPHYFLDGLKYHLSVTNADFFTTWMSQKEIKPADRIIITFMNFTLEAGKLFDNPWALGAMMGCKRQAFKDVGGFDSNISYGEDSEILKRAAEKGYKFKLFKDPKFSFSLRRFRKEGTLPLLRTYAQLDFGILLNGQFPRNSHKTYPMAGGEYYKDKKGYPQWIKTFDKTLERFKKIEGKQRLQKFMESFFND